MALKILSINVRGFGSPAKTSLIFHELNRLNYDFVFLQETHVSCKKRADHLESLWNGKCYWSFGTGKSAGVAVFVSPHFTGKIDRFVFDSDGRIFSALVNFGSFNLNLVNIYAPNTASDRKSFFERIHEFFLSQGDYIIAGDFNCVDRTIDKLHCSAVPSSDCNVLSSLKSDFSLVDVFRLRNPRAISFTWSNKDHSQASRLDRFFVSRSLFKGVRSNRVFPCTFSDHDFVDLDLSLSGFSNRRSGVWKFNSALLSSPDFVQLISDVIGQHKHNILNFNSLGEWWDNLKIQIRKSCIDFSLREKRLRNRKRSVLTKQLICAKQAFHNNPSGDTSEIRSLEGALSSLVLQEAEGAKIRSRAQWIEQGEKPTRFFFRLENKRAEKNCFSSLFDENGNEKSSQSDIESILSKFYQDLFTKDSSLDMQIQDELIEDLNLCLNDCERANCDGLISKDELLIALKGLPTGKSPGSDGLPTEFYLAFWNDLCDSLVLVLNERFRLGVMTDSQREGLIRLIHKKDDRRLPKNWRPISLLNTDYKLASKVITERLKGVMNSIVHSDQTCGVVGRTIFSNLQLVRDTLDMINKTDETGILVTLDQEKAFDRVDHDFLMRTLRKFGFGPSFCQWVALFYNNVFSRIICNGNLSNPVFLGRGVRQGCPLSPLLYVLVSEVLSTQVRKCREIEGFRLPGAGGLQFKISQYADDATNFVKNERSLHNLLLIVNRYERGSGAKLNTSKSEAMWLGKWRANGATPYGLRWVNKMRILGVFFSNGLICVEKDNWQAKLDKLKTVLNLWSSRDLSFIGRAMILNVLGASRFWHVAKVLPPPKWAVDSYKSIVWPFIWKGKMEPISRQRCHAPVVKGGLNIVDFATKCISLRLSNFASLRDSFGSEKWHYLARYFIGNRLAKFDTRFNFTSNNIPSCSLPSNFYRLCLDKFTHLHTAYNCLPDDLSCKNIYKLLVTSSSCAPRCAGFWGSVVGRPINRWASVWRKSRLKLNENKKNDILWLIIHRAVKVRYALKSWGYIDNDKCALCNRIETIEHCFLECNRVVDVWNFFSPTLSRFLNSPFSVSTLSVFYPLSDFQPPVSPSLYHFFVATVLFWTWHARNLSTFRNSVLSARNIIDLVLKDIKSRIRCATSDAVRNFWSTQSILCSVDENDVICFSI